MKTRKVISAILAGACALSAMSISALASSDASTTTTVKDTGKVVSVGETKYTVAGTVVTPVISVSLPSTLSAVINPYGVGVTDSKGNEYSSSGIASSEYVIRNYTTTSKVVVTAKASMTFTPAKDPNGTAATDTKSPYKVLNAAELKAITATKPMTEKGLGAYITTAVSTKNATGNKDSIDKASEDALTLTYNNTAITAASGTPGSTTYKPASHIVFNDTTQYTKGGVKEAAKDPTEGILMTLPAATKGADGKVDTYSYGKFAITGVLSPNTLAGGTWTTADKISFNLVFNVAPTA